MDGGEGGREIGEWRERNERQKERKKEGKVGLNFFKMGGGEH